MKFGLSLSFAAMTAAVALAGSAALADTYLVKPDGTGDFSTIQDAVDMAADDDVIELANGTFTGDGNRDVDFLGKRITVRSRGGDPGACVINCQGSEADPHRGFNFVSGEDSASVLQGVLIENGYAAAPWPQGNGGAVFCEQSSPTLDNCEFYSNTAAWSGGGVWIGDGSNPALSECVFSYNESAGGGGGVSVLSSTATFGDCTFYANTTRGEYGSGGGAHCEESSVAFSGCTFDANTATWGGGASCYLTVSAAFSECLFWGNVVPVDEPGGGGGMMCFGCSPSLSFCAFRENRADEHGGGVYLASASPSFTNCTFLRNSAELAGGGVYAESGSYPEFANSILAFSTSGEAVFCDAVSSATTLCCDIYGNAGGDWIGCLGGQEGVDGNIWENPRFCEPIEFGDPTIQADSPCAPFTPPNEECDLVGSGPVDCDLDPACGDWYWEFYESCEFCGHDASFETGHAEMNHDCRVDEIDGALWIAEFYSGKDRPYGDFSWNGHTGVEDWVILYEDYGSEVGLCEPCGMVPDSCAGRIRISFDRHADVDRLDLSPGVVDTAYVVGENCPGLVAATAVVEGSENVEIFVVSYQYSATIGNSTFTSLPWPDDEPSPIARVLFTVTDSSAATIGVKGSADFPDFGSLQWVQALTPWPPEYPNPQIRRMGFEYVSYGGINGDAPEDSLGCPAADVPEDRYEIADAHVLRLGPSAPNPWMGMTRIEYSVPDGDGGARTTLRLYDARGRLVRTLVDAGQGPGLYRVSWDGATETGERAAAGVYYYRLTLNGETRTRSMVLLR